MADGKIIIDTEIDSSGAEKGVNSLKSKIGSGFTTMGATAVKGIAAITGALTTLGIGCVNVASDLTEVQNVVDTTFGSSANQINQWAKDASKNFGLSELQAKQFTGTLGAMLKSSDITGDSLNAMSTDLVGLSADFSSFYNLSYEEAFEKITSAMNGETEAIRSLGINMNVSNLQAYALSKGINKSWNEMTQAEQTTLRYNYLMEKGADASGDFAKTLDTSLANQLRVAKNEITSLCGEIGQNLLPSVLNGTKVIREEIGNISEAFKNGGFNGMAEQIGTSIGTLLTKIAEQLPNIVNMGITIIQSLVNGIQQNLPMLVTSAMQIATSLITGITTMLPQLLQMGMQIIIQLAQGISQQIPTLIPLATNCILNLINTFITNLPQLINVGIQLLESLTNGLVQAIPQLIAQTPMIISALIDGIIQLLPSVINCGMQLLEAIITGILDMLPKLIETVPILIENFINSILSKLPDIIATGGNILLKLVDGIVNAIPKLIEAIPKIITGFITGISNNLPKIIEQGILIVGKLIVGLIQAIPQLIAALPQITNAIIKGFADVDWLSVGANIVKGIWNGIKSLASWLWNKVSGFAGDIVDSFKSKLGIHSPSRVMRDMVGRFIPQGISVGIDKEMPTLEADTLANLKGLYNKMQNVINSDSLGIGNRSIGNSYINNVVNNTNPTIKNIVKAVLNVDGKDLAESIAPHQEVFDNYALGR